MHWRTLVGAWILVVGCGGGSEPEATPVITGNWVLKDSSNTTSVGLSNRCVLWNRPLQITPLEGDTLYNGQEAAGGMMQCEVNGTEYPAGPVTQRPLYNYLIYVRGREIVITTTFEAQVYFGELEDGRRLAGRRDSTFDSRYGTWQLTR